MIKTWLKILKRNKIIFSYDMEDKSQNLSEKLIEKYLYKSCTNNNISIPVILRKHKNEIQQYNMTTFYKEDFLDDIDFDKMEFEVFKEEAK